MVSVQVISTVPSTLPVFSEGCLLFVFLVVIPSFCSVQMSSYKVRGPLHPWVGSGPSLAAFQEIKIDNFRGRVRAGVGGGSVKMLTFQRGWVDEVPHWCLGRRGSHSTKGWARHPRPWIGPELVSAASVTQPDSFVLGERRETRRKENAEA